MTLHKMKLNAEPFDMIKQGEKTIELRLNDDKRRQVQVGDQIIFEHLDDLTQTIQVDVIALHPFPFFEELYQALPLLECGYTSNNVETASPKDMEAYYSLEQQAQYGVLGIEISLSDHFS